MASGAAATGSAIILPKPKCLSRSFRDSERSPSAASLLSHRWVKSELLTAVKVP